jgi:[ribosomal protein S5]-alanine N-acetyltransferase
MVVRGPRLALRTPRPGDAGALFELGRDPEVSRFFSWGPYRERAEASAFIERIVRERPYELLIVDPDDRPIGLTGLSELSERDRRAVVGTWLGRDHWGTGANRESKALVLHLAFRHLDLQRVSAYSHPDNTRSLKALERIGFTREGTLKRWHIHSGQAHDVVILRLLREEWERTDLADVPARTEP